MDNVVKTFLEFTEAFCARRLPTGWLGLRVSELAASQSWRRFTIYEWTVIRLVDRKTGHRRGDLCDRSAKAFLPRLENSKGDL
jgi:hypothetical protein